MDDPENIIIFPYETPENEYAHKECAQSAEGFKTIAPDDWDTLWEELQYV
jgi:hypothetical protein